MMDNLIELKNVSHTFSKSPVLNNLSLNIKQGEIFGFLGPNGAGKTTSINIMVGLLKPSEGEVIFNKNIKESDIGLCPQDIVLWDYLTCYENLYTMGKMYDMDKDYLNSRIDSLLKRLSLENKRNTRADKLSGGMKRRMNIAMATIHEPSVLILDEPSEGLDPQSRRILWDYIKFQKDIGNTIILTTHLMDEADILSDRVAIIDEGHLIKLDTPDNLKASIGDGDILEITLNQDSGKCIDELARLEYVKFSKADGEMIVLNLLNATGRLPEIIKIIEKNNLTIKDISIRQNTLEEVFIELTGKELRE